MDTIVAIASPEGKGALGIVRLSGPKAWEISARASGVLPADVDLKHKKAVLTDLFDDNGNLVDQGILLPYKAPNSYTGEDLVEFMCHGGMEVTRGVLNRFIDLGARPANPGEFTSRAFLNGKMSLDQAEAVSLLIEAKTQMAARSAAKLLSGGLKGKLGEIRDNLLDIITKVEVGIDFIEEDIELEDNRNLKDKISSLLNEINHLIKHYHSGRYLHQGATVVIAGAPNSGKSTLMNHLAGYERSIVSKTPGTTRDYIDVTLDIKGVPVRLVDTAGLRDSDDEIEREGTRRAEELYSLADIIIWLISPPDFTPPPGNIPGQDNLFCVINKADVLDNADVGDREQIEQFKKKPALKISAKTGFNVDKLQGLISSTLLKDFDPEELLVLEGRHASLLEEAEESLTSAVDGLIGKAGLELTATDLRAALNSLGEITGEITNEDILNNIFSNFCIGK